MKDFNDLDITSSTKMILSEIDMHDRYRETAIMNQFLSEKIELENLTIFTKLKTGPEPSSKKVCNNCNKNKKEVLW